MNIQNTIKRQVELTELKLQNLKLIQNQDNLTTEDEKKVYLSNILQWVRTGNVQALKDAVSSNY